MKMKMISLDEFKTRMASGGSFEDFFDEAPKKPSETDDKEGPDEMKRWAIRSTLELMKAKDSPEWDKVFGDDDKAEERFQWIREFTTLAMFAYEGAESVNFKGEYAEFCVHLISSALAWAYFRGRMDERETHK